MDYAALFEHLARSEGYTVTSTKSNQLAHTWNQVHLGGQWWIVDVTWNSGSSFTDGHPIPDSVRRNPDFRRRFFLTTLDEEAVRQRARLINSTHHAPDTQPVDYQRTLEAKALIDQIQSINTCRNEIIAQRNTLVGQYNQTVAQFNTQPNVAAQAPYRTQLDRLKAQMNRLSSNAEDPRRKIDRLDEEYQQLERANPLGITYTRTQR